MFINTNFGIGKNPAGKAAKTTYGAKAGATAGLAGIKTSPKMQKYMRQAASALARLQKAIGCVKEAPIFMGPQSTDTFAVSLSYTGSEFDSFGDISMQVDQAACTQQNLSFAQDVAGSDYNTGTHSFAVELAGGESVTLSVEVQAGDSNAAVQQKMAAAINDAGLGIGASTSVHNDRGVNLSTLCVESEGMGDDAVAFTLKDVNGSLVRNSGIERPARQAQNAEYTVNGVAYTSTSNVVDVGNGITATIRGASRGEFAITDGFHEINAKNMLSILYTPLNDLQAIAEEMEKETGNDFLLLKMQAMLSQTESVLGQFGVFRGQDGLFDVNTAKADKAAKDGTLRSFLQSFYQNGGGFIAGLESFAATALQAPTVDKNV